MVYNICLISLRFFSTAKITLISFQTCSSVLVKVNYIPRSNVLLMKILMSV